MDELYYTVIPVDGYFTDICEPGTESLRYDWLSWDEALELVQLSFRQGYEVVIWRSDRKRYYDDETEDNGGGKACGEEQTEATVTD